VRMENAIASLPALSAWSAASSKSNRQQVLQGGVPCVRSTGLHDVQGRRIHAPFSHHDEAIDPKRSITALRRTITCCHTPALSIGIEFD
jgi:hypothetical protein